MRVLGHTSSERPGEEAVIIPSGGKNYAIVFPGKWKVFSTGVGSLLPYEVEPYGKLVWIELFRFGTLLAKERSADRYPQGSHHEENG
jgi:hypothetical protein